MHTEIQETGTRQHWVDTARSFAILCVIAGHMGIGDVPAMLI